MHIRTGLALVLFCTQAVGAFAATLSIDSNQSSLVFETPEWQRGSEWGLILPEGEMTIEGYEWQPISRLHYFSLSGTLEVVPAGTDWLGQPRLEVDSSHVVSPAPTEIVFELPRFLSIVNPAVGEIQWPNACGGVSTGGSATCSAPFAFEALTGTWSGGTLKIAGQVQKFIEFPGPILGGIEAPPIPEYTLADLGYSYYIVASVPEPSGAIMMTLGLVPLLLRRAKYPLKIAHQQT